MRRLFLASLFVLIGCGDTEAKFMDTCARSYASCMCAHDYLIDALGQHGLDAIAVETGRLNRVGATEFDLGYMLMSHNFIDKRTSVAMISAIDACENI